MAVLSKIRKRSGLLLLAIGFALLAFVIQDIFNSGMKSISTDVGSVNGKDISFDEFRIKVANTEKNAQNGQQMTSMQASNQVWNQEVQVALLNAEFEKLGIRVGEKHIIEAFKSDPNIGQNQMFLNAAGKFDLNKFKEAFSTSYITFCLVDDGSTDNSYKIVSDIEDGRIQIYLRKDEIGEDVLKKFQGNKAIYKNFFIIS